MVTRKMRVEDLSEAIMIFGIENIKKFCEGADIIPMYFVNSALHAPTGICLLNRYEYLDRMAWRDCVDV